MYFRIEAMKKGKASSWANADMNDGKQAGVGHFLCTGACRSSPDSRNKETKGERFTAEVPWLP